MRYISKHGADVYLDKEEGEEKKTQDRGKRAPTPTPSSNVTFAQRYGGVNSCSCTMPWDGLTFV